ncbi:hypothetical protein NL461_20695, partial [Klebsiella pneumoniae]|nr:hypothetical protein [Klebsiella pneumoniae]
KRAYCLKTQPATGETYPKSDLFNKAAYSLQPGALLGYRARKVFLLFYRSNIYRVLRYEGKGVIMVYLIDN